MHLRSFLPVLGLSALSLFAAASVSPVAADTCSVYCTVTVDDSDDLSLFIIGTHNGNGVTSFSASAGSNSDVAAIDFSTNAPVTTANGNANIKGTNSSFTEITLTPAQGTSFDGVLLRGQIGTPKGGSYNGVLNATITD